MASATTQLSNVAMGDSGPDLGKIWGYDEALTDFGKTDRIMKATGLDKFYAAGGQMGMDSDAYTPQEYTPGKVMGRSWGDILRGNAYTRYGKAGMNLSDEELEQLARTSGIAAGREEGWGDIFKEGLGIALPFALAIGGAGMMSGAEGAGFAGAEGTSSAAYAGGGEVGSGYAASAPELGSLSGTAMGGSTPSWLTSQPSLSGPASVIGPDGIARSAIPNTFGYTAPSAGMSTAGDSLLSSGAFAGGMEATPDLAAFSAESFDPSSLSTFAMDAGVPESVLGPGASFSADGGWWGNLMNEMSPDEIFKKMKARPLASAFNLGTGLYGLNQANQLSKMAMEASRRSDPFGPHRAQYADRLNALYKDPSQVQKLPGYKAGLQAVERKMASQGYNNSGNMMIALQDYGGRAFDSEAARLSALAGANFGPSSATEIAGQTAAMSLRGQALNRFGLGLLR